MEPIAGNRFDGRASHPGAFNEADNPRFDAVGETVVDQWRYTTDHVPAKGEHRCYRCVTVVPR